MEDQQTQLLQQLARVVAPALAADAGELYFVRASEQAVHLHVAGAYSGCPSVGLLRQRLFEPLVSALYPEAELTVSSGLPQPEGAQRIEPQAP